MAADSDKPADTMVDDLARLASEAAPAMSVQQQGRGLAVVLGRLEARLDVRRGRVRLGLLGLATGLAACVFLFAVVHRPGPGRQAALPESPVLTYQVESGEILDGGYLRSMGDKGMALRFSEGTHVQLLPGTRGRLRSVSESGAHLAIEQGPARVEVTHRPGSHWLIDAGPFLITVRGTVFTVAWDSSKEQLDLRMEKGLVSVTGPVSEAGIAVRGGQRLTIDLPKKEVLLRELNESGPRPLAKTSEHPSEHASTPPAAVVVVTAPPAAQPAADPGKTATVEHNPHGAPHARGTGAFGWAAAMAAGEVDSILRDVERIGLKRALVEASSDDLSALADAARYRKQDDVAEQALLTQRGRFEGSARACDAAFLLGRLEESHEGGGLRALAWYDSYLEGDPTGAYASEALGRKMIVTQHLMGSPAARVVADEYLERFPTGTYAGAARALRQAP
jgi:FecR protein